MKKITKATFGVIAVFLLSVTFMQCKDAKNAAVSKFMELQAEQVNKECPMDMGYGLTLDKCETDGDKTIKYLFTASDEIAGQLNVSDEMKPLVVQTIKGLPEFTQIKQFEISFLYLYYDTNKKLLGEMKITPEDYK